MANTYFRFKQFTVHHDRCAMKVSTDSCLFGAWCAEEVHKFAVQDLPLLDVGSGSGLLSLMMLQKNSVIIDAIEIDPEAAQQGAENIAASPWKERTTVYNENILQWEPATGYHIIISNPPFYEGDLKSDKEQKNTAHHSSQLTLSQLLHCIKNNLTADGKFFLLLPYHRLGELQNLTGRNALFLQQMIAVKQTTGHSPFRLLIQGSPVNTEKTVDDEISIKDGSGQYTQQFIALLKDYYLYL